MAFFEHILLNILENKGQRILKIVQNVRINLYFDIPSKTQFRQNVTYDLRAFSRRVMLKLDQKLSIFSRKLQNFLRQRGIPKS